MLPSISCTSYTLSGRVAGPLITVPVVTSKREPWHDAERASQPNGRFGFERATAAARRALPGLSCFPRSNRRFDRFEQCVVPERFEQARHRTGVDEARLE